MPLGQRFGAVLVAARAGADWAWSEIYRELAPAVLGYLRAGGAPDPENVGGDVFLQLVRDLPSFEGDERDFRAWAFTVAHHRLIDERRRRSRRPMEVEVGYAGTRPDLTADPEEEALGNLIAADLRRLISQLSRDQQATLLLRTLGGLTVEEVGRVLGKRPGAVKALQRRALAAVEREFAKEAVTL